MADGTTQDFIAPWCHTDQNGHFALRIGRRSTHMQPEAESPG
jgi:hypothetical protein